MSGQEIYPQLRYVDVIPFEDKNQTFFYLRDPMELAKAPLVVTGYELFILSMFDGQHRFAEIQQKFAEKFGVEITIEQLQQIIAVLEDNFYLNSSRFVRHFQQLQEEFRNAAVRAAWHAGTAYPEDPLALRSHLEELYRGPGGAGAPADFRPFSANGKPKEAPFQVSAIMAPHIDLRVGGSCYTHAYRRLLEAAPPAEVYVILGVAHFGGNGFFTATSKDFETPLGTVKTDRDFLESWQRQAGQDFTRAEWAHRTEHSIEFQLPFLQHLFTHDYTVVPVLCGSPVPYLQHGKSLDDAPEVQRALEALRKTVADDARRIQFILSVDLAHMGPKFADPFPITEEKAREIRAADQQMFEVITRFDKKAFQELMVQDLLPRNVDACSAIYTLLSLTPAGRAEVLDYGQNLQSDTQSIVTYGSMAFYKKAGK